MKRAYTDVLGGQIHYCIEGRGDPLLLLHQSPLSLNQYLDMIPILGKNYRVMAIDTPGYGKSDKPPCRYGITDYARCVVSFLDALSIHKTSIVGDHTGAAIAVEVATSYPERVDNLILAGCPHYEPEVRKSRLTDPRYQQMEIKEDGSHLFKAWQFWKGYGPNLKPESWHRSVTDMLVAGMNWADAFQALFRYDVGERLPLVKSPTLLISGTEDFFFHRLEATSSLIPRCRKKVIEGGGDVISYERAKEFADAILKFLSDPGM